MAQPRILGAGEHSGMNWVPCSGFLKIAFTSEAALLQD